MLLTGTVYKSEAPSYHPGVDVYFQPNAYMDGSVAEQWAARTFTEFMKRARDEAAHLQVEVPEKMLVLCDNFGAHKLGPFMKRMSEAGCLLWFYPPATSDLTQPVDQGYGEVSHVWEGHASA